MQHPFPSISPFLELIQWEERTPNKIILRDRSTGRTATAGQLLHSVALFRAKVQAILGKDSVDNVGNSKENRIILLLAPPGLEYVVSMLTIFSLGAGMSAQCKLSYASGKALYSYRISSNRYQARGDETNH